MMSNSNCGRDKEGALHNMSTTGEESDSSSEDEASPSHPPALHNSMYSKIYEDVHSRIPSINLALENDEENDSSEADIVEVGMLIANHNGISHGEMMTQNGNEAAAQLQGLAQEVGIFQNSQDGDEDTSQMKASAAFYSNPFDFAEESHEDEGANQKDANSLENVNGLAQVSANEMDGNLTKLSRNKHEIDGSSKVNGSYQTYAKSESGIVSNSTGTSTNTKLASARIDTNFEARRTKLQDDIDENSLDECLATFERGPLYEYEKERISKLNLNSMTPTSSTDDEDNETPLLDKLSSLSLSAKNSVCQANDLLKKLSGKQIEYGKREERVAMIDDSKRLDDKKEPDKTSSRVLDQEDEEDKETVFIDLRNDIRELRIKDPRQARVCQNTVVESSSSSGEEDYQQNRRDLKAGVSKNHKILDKQKGGQNLTKEIGCPSDNMVHERITRRSFENLKKNHNITNAVDVNQGGQQPVNARLEQKKGKTNLAFDIEPLEDKIWSWHQVEDSNHNRITKLIDVNRQIEELRECTTDHCELQGPESKGHESKVHKPEGHRAEHEGQSSGDQNSQNSGKSPETKRAEAPETYENAMIRRTENLIECEVDLILNEAYASKKQTLAEDSSLLKLEEIAVNRGTTCNDNLLIIDSDKREENCHQEYSHSRTNLEEVDISFHGGKNAFTPCIEELSMDSSSTKVRISDNLMLIKADLSMETSPEETLAHGKAINESLERTYVDNLQGEEKVCHDTNRKSKQGNEGNSNNDEKNSSSVEQKFNPAEYCEMVCLDDVQLHVLRDCVFDTHEIKHEISPKKRTENHDTGACSGQELKTYSVAESRETSPSTKSSSGKNKKVSPLKGLLPQFGETFSKGSSNKNGYCRPELIENEARRKVSVEETPQATKQETARTTSVDKKRSRDSNSKNNKEKKNAAVKSDFKLEKKNASVKIDGKSEKQRKNSEQKETDVKASSGDASRKEVTSENATSTAEGTANSKKKKSKRKNRKSAEDPQQEKVIITDNSYERKLSSQDAECKGKERKMSKSSDHEKIKKPLSNLKESERLKIKDKVKLLQEQVGMANVIFDEDVSFSQTLKPLPDSCKRSSKLLLKISLQSPGVCSKSCAKNTLSFTERSDAYIGLCTLFLSLLHGGKFKLCESLGIPFDVIALEQASVDSELQLLIGVIENENTTQPNQTLKRGKPQKTKKSFHQMVTHFLNKTDLEIILSSLMEYDFGDTSLVTSPSCPGSKKLSSYVSVSQDEAAVDRIFGLKPSMTWYKTEAAQEQINENVSWIPRRNVKNQNTCLLVENIAAMLPRTISAFMKTIRDNSLDICGIRLAYATRKDGKDKPCLAVAVRGPNVTTVQSGKAFTTQPPELSCIKSNYMPLGATCASSISDPLITYTIGRGRGEREVVNWFGRRTYDTSDVEAFLNKETPVSSSKVHQGSVPERLDILSRATANASLLSVTTDSVVLSMSPLVPSVFILVAMTAAESRGLYPISVGKVLLNEDDMTCMGLKTDVGGTESKKEKSATSNYCVSIILFEGENAAYRAHGFLKQLFQELNAKMPRDALTEDALMQRLNGLIRYERVKRERGIDEFFAVTSVNKKIIKILERMTAPHLSHNDVEVIAALPPHWTLNLHAESARVCAAIFIGKPMLEIFPDVLRELFEECAEDPFGINGKAKADKKYVHQERPMGEVIGIKCYSSLPKQFSHVCSPHVIGAKPWLRNVEQIQKGPVLVLVFRLIEATSKVLEKCEKVHKHVGKLLNAGELQCPLDSHYDAYAHTDMDTVFRVLLDMFDADELMPDSCCTWFKNTQWPIYLKNDSAIVQDMDPLVGLLSTSNQQKSFSARKDSQKAPAVRILSPLSLNVPAGLILNKQQSFSFIQFEIDMNYMKYVAKVLGMLGRDGFSIIGLSFPGGLSPSYESTRDMHVAVRRCDAVFRLNQWLPDLTDELHKRHDMKVSPGAKEAYDAIVRNFQKTETGGVFDKSTLATTEKLTFRNDEVFATAVHRRVEWSTKSTGKASSSSSSSSADVKHVKHGTGPNHVLVMPEVNVIIVTNVMMRSHYLGKRLTENVKYLGFWEKLSALEFKTIAARMTSLNQEQTEELLGRLSLPAKEQRLMTKRMSSSNGPIFVLALLKDFALSNFWNTICRTLNESEEKIVRENVLVPTSRNQVDVLLGSFFEAVVPNSEVEIKRV